MSAVAREMRAMSDEFAKTVSREMGKPLKEAEAEVGALSWRPLSRGAERQAPDLRLEYCALSYCALSYDANALQSFRLCWIKSHGTCASALK